MNAPAKPQAFDPDVTTPGVIHAARIAHLARTMSIRMRHMREMQRDGWRFVESGAANAASPSGKGSGFALVPPVAAPAVDDFEITIEGE